jgi:DNA-binding NtrC family response regulator
MEQQSVVVMVVDDEPLIRSLMTERLDLEGYTVLAAATAEEAIEILRDHSVQAVISDVRMPGPMHGIGLALWVKEHEPDVSMILISGHDGAKVRRLLPKTPFFQKPFQVGEVVSELGHCLARH